MARELVHIGDDHGFSCSVRMPAQSAAEIDSRARERPLERPKDELISFLQVKPHPKEPERLFQHRSKVRQVRDQVSLPRDEGLDLRSQFLIDLLPARGLRKCNTLGHITILSHVIGAANAIVGIERV